MVTDYKKKKRASNNDRKNDNDDYTDNSYNLPSIF